MLNTRSVRVLSSDANYGLFAGNFACQLSINVLLVMVHQALINMFNMFD